MGTFPPIKADCKRTYYPAAHDSGTRPNGWADIHVVVLHSEEASTAASAAKWFQNPDSKGSAHLCVDDRVCYLSLHPLKIAWAAPPLNTHGFHIEQAGFARWSSIQWLYHRPTVKRAAYHTAKICKRAGIPLVWLSPADVRAYKKGITSHANVSKAWGYKYSSHTDPGLFWPRRYFMRLVRRYYAEL